MRFDDHFQVDYYRARTCYLTTFVLYTLIIGIISVDVNKLFTSLTHRERKCIHYEWLQLATYVHKKYICQLHISITLYNDRLTHSFKLM